MTESLRKEQSQRNQQGRENWARYGAHRHHITQLLRDASTADAARLCLVGAGNCNDVDLSEIAERYREIHLVDLDADAMTWGLAQQGLIDHSKFILHSDYDVSGLGDIYDTWRTHPPNSEDLRRTLVSLAKSPRLPGNPPFDVVASLCLLSQLIESISTAIGKDHPDLLSAISAVRMGHLQQLAENTCPGGTLILVMEIVSSVTYPALPNVSDDDLPQVIWRLINERNFFTGLNPLVVHRLFNESRPLSPLIGESVLTRPWLWDFGPRVYACCAIVAKRKNHSG